MELNVHGRRVRFRLWGAAGPRLLLIHPIGLDADFWAAVADRLANRYRLLAYDLPGHGASDPLPGPYTMEDLADQAAALLSATEFAPAAIAGLSIGGMVAMHMALRHPELVTALILADTLARGSPIMHERARLARGQGMEALVAPTLERWYPPTFLSAHPEAADAVARRLRADDPEQHARAWEAIAGHDATAGLGSLTVPTLVVVGRLDVSTPPAVAEGIAAAIPGARLEVVEGAGHLAPFQDPDAFCRIVADFLGRGKGA